MLNLRFFNVGDGDAILVEELSEAGAYRLLVDTGRDEVERGPDSRRQTAAEHLACLGIDFLDAVVITHLHVDHFGGLRALLDRVKIGRVYSGFFPGEGKTIPPDPNAPKTVRGLVECLNRWREDTCSMEARGISLCPVTETVIGLTPAPGLEVDLICPDSGTCAIQHRVWDAMMTGGEVPDGLKYWASKFRNPGSLRLRLRYAGRCVELTGDCCASEWEREAQPCDILKVPHHGDRLALTPRAVDGLDPKWAVISCGQEYIARKDRPSPMTLALLRSRGTRVWFTDAFAEPGREPERWSSVDFTICGDGGVLTPEGRASGGK